jgi:hypothetical protein
MWGIVGEYMGAPTVKALQSVLSGFVSDTQLLRIRPWLQQRFDLRVQRRMNRMRGEEESRIRREFRPIDTLWSELSSLSFKLLSEPVYSDPDSDSDTN